MSDAFVKKNLAASMDFHEYMATHPDLYDAIPNGAYIVFTIQNDQKFNVQSLALVRDRRRKKIVEAHKSGTAWSVRPLQAA